MEGKREGGRDGGKEGRREGSEEGRKLAEKINLNDLCSPIYVTFPCIIDIKLFFFLVVLGFELRASYLVGRCAAT
jgi:hypothetical protein